MNHNEVMLVGNYVNLFEVKINEEDLILVKEERKKYPSLKELRGKIKKCRVYPFEDKVYGYGKDLSELRDLGFKDVKTIIFNLPQLTCRMILEGFSDNLEYLCYEVEPSKFRNQAFNKENPINLSIKGINLYQGCEFRTTFLMNPLLEKLFFGVILDLKFKLEIGGNSASYQDIWQFVLEKYDSARGSQFVREIKVKTGDLTPHGRRSSEASKFRYEKIIKIINNLKGSFELPNGSMATLIKEPVRVIMEE